MHCGHETAIKPAPEAGQWFQAHFEEGIKNANTTSLNYYQYINYFDSNFIFFNFFLKKLF